MTITATQRDGNGRVLKVAQGAHLDDAGTPAAVTLTLGFEPEYFVLENVTDRIKFEWYKGMTETNTIKTVAAGTRTLDTGSAILVDDGTAGTTSSGLVNSPPGTQPTGTVVLAAANILQNKQYVWRAEG